MHRISYNILMLLGAPSYLGLY